MKRPSITLTPGPIDLTGTDRRYFNRGELDALIHLIRSVEPKVVVEFGCNEGRAAAAILRNTPSIQSYVGIDVLSGYVTIQKCQRREVPADPGRLVKGDLRFRLILRKRGSFDLTPADLPACDAAFIDADHSRAGVLCDTALAKAIVRPGGILVWHDDNYLKVVEVSQTLDELHVGGDAITRVDDTWLAFMRVPRGVSAPFSFQP
jgi:SAM-dependent methyltransferase